jgi:hypothetical protein
MAMRSVDFTLTLVPLHLTVTAPSPGSPTFRIRFETLPGQSYRILSSADLIQWETMGTVVGTGAAHQLPVPGGEGVRFYQIQPNP